MTDDQSEQSSEKGDHMIANDPIAEGLGLTERDKEAKTLPGMMYVSSFDLEDFGKSMLRQGEEQAKRRGGKREPEVFSASDELNAVKYAREMGYISDLEAQKKVRKLLRLPGKRTLAARRARRAR